MTKNMYESLKDKKDQALANLISEIMMSDYFTGMMEKIVATGGFIDKKIQNALNAFRVASKREMEDMEERIVRLERRMTRVITTLEELKEKTESKPRKLTSTSAQLEAVCENCGKAFVKKTINQKFCSAACRAASK